tara:strand:- start:364 stop:1086 length:723 start_codon:yes stop_codon:yes gene_type:complete
MFVAEIIFVSITLLILVAITFYLKVPKASIPLLVIYLIFILRNESSDEPDKFNVDYKNLTTSKNEVILENEHNIDLHSKKKEIEKSIIPKPLTFDAEPKLIEKNKVVKKEIKSKKSVKKKPNIEKNISLVVQDIKICKSIYKRTPVGSDVVFTNNVDSLYCYTRIQNPGPKREVKHIWYYNNQMMTQVRYNVKKSNIYRSWTKKTILSNQIGKWRVDIQDNNGTIIGSKNFEIKNISDYN